MNELEIRRVPFLGTGTDGGPRRRRADLGQGSAGCDGLGLSKARCKTNGQNPG